MLASCVERKELVKQTHNPPRHGLSNHRLLCVIHTRTGWVTSSLQAWKGPAQKHPHSQPQGLHPGLSRRLVYLNKTSNLQQQKHKALCLPLANWLPLKHAANKQRNTPLLNVKPSVGTTTTTQLVYKTSSVVHTDLHCSTKHGVSPWTCWQRQTPATNSMSQQL